MAATKADGEGQPPRLDYICLQPTRQGQASHAHVHEIVAGLRRRGWVVRLVQPPLPQGGRFDPVRRGLAAATAQLSFWLGRRFRRAPAIYIRTHFLSFPSALMARVVRATVIQEMNGPIEDGYDAWPQLRRVAWLMSFLYRTQLRWADTVITVTPGLVDYVRQFCGRDSGFAVVGNGADVDRFRPLDPSAAHVGRPYAVFVGALASWQGIDTVLAAAQSPGWPAGLDLAIAGDGKERPRAEAAAKRFSHIKVLGTIPYAESATLVSGSALALVPMNDMPRSAFGLSPLKLFEAMASGVPVVASDLPGLADVVVRHQCGVLFPAGNADALTEAVGRMVSDPASAREMGRRGRLAAVENYSWDARAEQTRVAIVKAIEDRASRGTGPRSA